MQDLATLATGLVALAGLTFLASINEITVINDLLVGFGLGTVIGAAIAVTRGQQRVPHPEQIMLPAGLWGAAIAVLIYVIAEVP